MQASQKSLGTTKKELWDRCDFTMKQLDLMTLEMKQKITAITEDVEYKVGKAMSEEIRRLSILVNEFRIANEESGYRIFYKNFSSPLGKSLPARGTKFRYVPPNVG